MHSEHSRGIVDWRKQLARTVAMLALIVVGACDKDERATAICKRVWQCGGLYGEGTCEDRVNDAIADGRISAEQASSCASCLRKQRNDCTSLLSERDCDTACTGLFLVTKMYTTEKTRQCACVAPAVLCGLLDAGLSDKEAPLYEKCSGDAGITRDAGTECGEQIANQIRMNPNLDFAMANCAACLRAAEQAISTQDTSSAALVSCSTTTCSAACSDFPSIGSRIESLNRTRSFCDWVSNCEALGQNGGTSDAGTTADCPARVQAAAVAPLTMQSCVDCLSTSGGCSAAYGELPMSDDGGVPTATAEGCIAACAGLPTFEVDAGVN